MKHVNRKHNIYKESFSLLFEVCYRPGKCHSQISDRHYWSRGKTSFPHTYSQHRPLMIFERILLTHYCVFKGLLYLSFCNCKSICTLLFRLAKTNHKQETLGMSFSNIGDSKIQNRTKRPSFLYYFFVLTKHTRKMKLSCPGGAFDALI